MTSGNDLTIQQRNDAAFKRMKARAVAKIFDAYTLVDQAAACEALSIKTDELLHRVSTGDVLAYTLNGIRIYPDFQFTLEPGLLKAFNDQIGLNTEDASECNIVLHFLSARIDYSNFGEPENIRLRRTLLGDKGAVEIMVRDYDNRYEMGK